MWIGKYTFYFWILCFPLTMEAFADESPIPLVEKEEDFGTLYVNQSYTKRIFIMNFNKEPVSNIEFEFLYNKAFDYRGPLYNHNCPKILKAGKFCYFTIMFTPSFGTLKGELHVYWNNREHYALSRIKGFVSFSNP